MRAPIDALCFPPHPQCRPSDPHKDPAHAFPNRRVHLPRQRVGHERVQARQLSDELWNERRQKVRRRAARLRTESSSKLQNPERISAHTGVHAAMLRA